TCSGLGQRKEVDPELVVPDPDASLAEGAIHPWSRGMSAKYFGRMLAGLANELEFDLETPWQKLPKRVRTAVLHGSDTQVHISYRNRFGRRRSYYSAFEGVVP